MNPVKKILVLHSDVKIRRRIALLLADAGLDVRAHPDLEAATEQVRGEWFDLALIDEDISGRPETTSIEKLRKLQPTLPILLLVPKLELPLVVQGIRLGVADVVALDPDPGAVLQKVRSLIGLAPVAADNDVTPGEIADIETMIEGLESGAAPASDSAAAADLLRVSRENASLAARVERLLQEKSGLEAELRTLLAQTTDAQRMEAELAELKTERELAAATQAAIDEKARGLSELRAAVAAERNALAKEREASPAPGSREASEIEAWKRQLDEREDSLAGEAHRIRQDAAQLAHEKRRWHDDLDLLRDREENLRVYEARLREIQSQLEADRVLWFSTQSKPAQVSPFVNDAALKEAWTKLQRATELLEAEQSNLKDERLTMTDREAAVKRREELVRDREIKTALNEKRLKELPPASQTRGTSFGLPRLALGRRS